jgi:hypothetical protein
MARIDSDEYYVIDLCDEVLGREGLRQHRFDFLLGDPSPKTGRQVKLPVDVYYPDLPLVVEYNTPQHSEPFPDRRQTVRNTGQGQRRILYGRRRREVLPRHGINLIEIAYVDLPHDSRKHLLRTDTDRQIIHQFLAGYVFTSGMRSHNHYLLRTRQRARRQQLRSY